jgi:hypothetical protein
LPAPSEAAPKPRFLPQPEIAFVGLLSAAAMIFFGIIPQPLFTFAWHAAHAITGLF